MADISFTGKRELLSRLYGKTSPGTLTAIMGPSGAGKTTLLNILAGHVHKGYEGEVHVNGYLRSVELFNMQSCYVMQDDCLLQELTVREAIALSLELRTSTIRGENIALLVTEVMEQWGLDECADTLTRCLSGGERKRLAISQELIGNSPVILLDEPTSGLDSSSALRCVKVLKSLAASGRTVLCSIHNPSARLFSQFDNLYMLSEGKCIYNGSVAQLPSFLESLESHKFHCPVHSSPSDLITEIAFGEHGEMTTKLSSLFIPDDIPVNSENRSESSSLTSYGGRIMSDKEKEEMKRQYEVRLGYWKQFKILMKRCFLCVTRNKATCIGRMLACMFFALMLSVMYYDSGNKASQIRETIMMYIVAMLMLLFAYAGANVLTYPLEINVLLREQRNCWYSPGLYFVSRALSELPMTIVGPAFMMPIVHWMTSQPMEFNRLALVILFSIQYASTSESIGYVTSTPFSPEVAVMLCLPAATPSFLFCGFFVRPPTSVPGHQVAHVHFALVLRDTVLDIIDAADVDLLACAAAVLGIDILLKVVAFALLKWRLRRKQ
ncbi:hypothetical protein MRX96_001139 [Rhipicephalus microplus]